LHYYEFIILTYRRKLYSKFNSVWFQFPTPNDVIIPLEEVKATFERLNFSFSDLSKQRIDLLNLNDIQSFDLSYLHGRSEMLTNRVPVAVLLGHYNHGKTTLLDALCNTDIVSTEAHGITQVRIHFLYPLQ